MSYSAHLTSVSMIAPGDRYLLPGDDRIYRCVVSEPVGLIGGAPCWKLISESPKSGGGTLFSDGWCFVHRVTDVHPGMSSKSRRTLAVMDALMGVQHVNENPKLMAENHAIWMAEYDRRLADPASAPPDQRQLLDLVATWEWALKQEGQVFGTPPLRAWGWATYQLPDGRIVTERAGDPIPVEDTGYGFPNPRKKP